MGVVRVLADSEKPTEAGLTNREDQVVFEVSRWIVGSAALDAGFFTIFEVKQVHLETVKDVNLTCIDQDQQVPSEIPSREFNRVHVLIDLRLNE